MPSNKPPALPRPAKASRTNLILTIGVVVVAALVFGGVVLAKRQSEPTPTAVPAATAAQGAASSATMTAPGHVLSSAGPDAPELVEFIDFQCESCHAFYQTVTAQLLTDYQDRINFTIRLYPLPGHPLAMPAAQAAEAAARQGKFAPFYSTLFQEYDTWAGHTEGGAGTDDLARGRAYFLDVADRLDLDIAQFTADMDSPEVAATIAAGIEAGGQLGVTGTPTFFLDGERFGGSATSFAEFDQQLRAALDQGIG